ncbi:hypothetical protein BC938DRAFT_478833 [Jimgerdemannia flammicorona]|uniref:Uncharacterized protein n=1 Tax=Jimgerdemannia flammicorona TaxID=994334 RepID=A0A433QM49_9FUNG|nr:hypothetical protein BC938DRAFT_478833 [Jimgerdemannia flammicorona]
MNNLIPREIASSVPTFLNTTFLASGLSRNFYELLTHVGDAKSKEVRVEEDDYIDEEIGALKAKIGQPDVSSVRIANRSCSKPPSTQAKMKEYVTRLIYCNMLGHDVDFGIIHAIMLTQSAERVEERRTGKNSQEDN